MKKIITYAVANTPLFFNEVIKKSIRENDDIEWGIIYPKAVYKNLSDNIVKKENILYLYKNFNKIYRKTDKFDFQFKFEQDNIFRIIRSSKNHLRNFASFKQLKIAKTIYSIYKNFLLKTEPDYIILPDLEVVDGIILINLCHELNIEPLYFFHTRLFGMGIFSNKVYEDLPAYYGNFEEKDKIKSKEFLDNYMAGNISPANKIIEWTNNNSIQVKKEKFLKRTIRSLFYRFFKGENKCLDKYSIATQIKVNLAPLVYKYRKIRYQSYHKFFFHIKTDHDPVPENFILFALQKTPESSINVLEQYFVDQERAIDLILLNMPHNFYLLVKEHPVMTGERPTSFYRKMRARPGVLLVDPNVNTDNLAEKSKLVASITGTIGLECYLKDKPCLLFGRNFFRHLCYSLNDYRNFKTDLYKMIFEYQPPSEEEKIEEIAKIYNVSYPCFISDPIFQSDIMEQGNIENFLKYIKTHIARLQAYKKENTNL